MPCFLLIQLSRQKIAVSPTCRRIPKLTQETWRMEKGEIILNFSIQLNCDKSMLAEYTTLKKMDFVMK